MTTSLRAKAVRGLKQGDTFILKRKFTLEETWAFGDLTKRAMRLAVGVEQAHVLVRARRRARLHLLASAGMIASRNVRVRANLELPIVRHLRVPVNLERVRGWRSLVARRGVATDVDGVAHRLHVRVDARLDQRLSSGGLRAD